MIPVTLFGNQSLSFSVLDWLFFFLTDSLQKKAPSVITPLSRTVAPVWIALAFLAACYAFSDSTAFASVMTLIANSVCKAQLGEVNGIAQTGVALVRSMGPAIGAPLFAWSVSNGRPFPFNVWLCFLFQAVLLCGVLAFSFWLSPSLNEPFREEELEMPQK